MNADDADLAMAQLRLRAALEEHVAETEEVPPEVVQAARDAYSERFGTT